VDNKKIASELVELAKNIVARDVDDDTAQALGVIQKLVDASSDLVEYVESEISGDPAAKKNHKKYLDAVKDAIKRVKQEI
jgi:hypothetical protein